MNDANKPKDLNIKAIFKEAWQLVPGTKMSFFILSIPVFILAIFTTIVITTLVITFVVTSDIMSFAKIPAFLFYVLVFVLIGFIFWCITAMSIMLGVRAAIRLPTSITLVRREIMAVLKELFFLFLFACAISLVLQALNLANNHYHATNRIVYAIVQLIVLVVSFYGLLLNCALWGFGIPLVVIKKFKALPAFKQGLQIVHRYWIEITFCWLCMVVIIAISSIPFLIGLIWTIPMGWILSGILFRDLMGLKQIRITTIDKKNGDA